MKDKKIATSLLVLTLVSGALVVGPVHADAATNVKSVTTSSSLISKKGKLVSKKTGKAVKGYASFKGKVYKNGVKFTGVLNSKYYKSGSKSTALYKGKYYKKGSLATASYKNVYYVKGKVASGVFNKKYYSKGNLGTGVYKNIYYAKGQKATGVYNKLYYVKGELFSGKKGNIQYVKGANKGAYEIENPFLLRKYYIINQASELPTTVTVTKSDGVSVMQKVTWTMDEKDQSSITLKDGVLTGTTNGEYVLTGTVANSKIKQKLYVVIANVEATFASINQSIEELKKFEKLVEEAKKNKENAKVQTSAAPTTAQSTINSFYIAYFARPADPAELNYWWQNLNLNGNPLQSAQAAAIAFGPPIIAAGFPSIPGMGTSPTPASPTPLTPINSLAAASALNGVLNATTLLQTLLGSSNQANAPIIANQLTTGLNYLNNFQAVIGGLGSNLIPPAVTQVVTATTNQTQNKIDAINNPTPVTPTPVEPNPNNGGKGDDGGGKGDDGSGLPSDLNPDSNPNDQGGN